MASSIWQSQHQGPLSNKDHILNVARGCVYVCFFSFFFFFPVQIVRRLCCLARHKPQTRQRRGLSVRLLLFCALGSTLSFPNINRQPSTCIWRPWRNRCSHFEWIGTCVPALRHTVLLAQLGVAGFVWTCKNVLFHLGFNINWLFIDMRTAYGW